MANESYLHKLSNEAWVIQLKQDCKWAFTEHPRQTGETYIQHLCFTVGMSARFLLCWAALIVHGVFPFLLTHTVSRQMEKIHEVLKSRASHDHERAA